MEVQMKNHIDKIMIVLRHFQNCDMTVDDRINELYIYAPKHQLFNDKNYNFSKEKKDEIYDILNELALKNVNITIISDGVEHQII